MTSQRDQKLRKWLNPTVFSSKIVMDGTPCYMKESLITIVSILHAHSMINLQYQVCLYIFAHLVLLTFLKPTSVVSRRL